jgi:hypothetical protein
VFTEVEKYLESAHEENQPQQFALDNRTASHIAIISVAIPALILDGKAKHWRLPEYKEIQNPINTPQNQQKIKLAANGDYDIKNRMRITEIFIQARQRSTRDQSHDFTIMQ